MSFEDLKNSAQPDERMSYEFLIILLDKLFGQHDHVRVDAEAETEHNHGIIFLQWKQLQHYYNLPSTVKKTQKLVRQTLKHIIEHLNKKHHFTQPIKLEQKRHDSYQKGKGIVTQYWVEICLI